MRAPFQVLVFPYQIISGEPHFLIALRSDMNVWQGISGGGEDHESTLEAAKRELVEETKLVGTNWKQLDSMCMLPKVFYAGNENWAEHQFVVPEYSFSVKVFEEPHLSSEHTAYQWCSFKDAHELLKYDSNKIALWEANQRLKLSGLEIA
ncbi:NUDIX pyrophosphatase [Vibrio sp. 99-70-13A1]|uniref:NUDIX hydrolase n=1 Tax=Vibrio sp. 99-70-13A1 TaxID=2607601 RepID=UPI001493C31D|nr:NUDIX pyrophosphatase [Vibrio sp. 99-70-13A1]NOH99466.1 NUDIX pyrophosphatase [Vibrio sp. 99-70-13A1]